MYLVIVFLLFLQPAHAGFKEDCLQLYQAPPAKFNWSSSRFVNHTAFMVTASGTIVSSCIYALKEGTRSVIGTKYTCGDVNQTGSRPCDNIFSENACYCRPPSFVLSEEVYSPPIHALPAVCLFSALASINLMIEFSYATYDVIRCCRKYRAQKLADLLNCEDIPDHHVLAHIPPEQLAQIIDKALSDQVDGLCYLDGSRVVSNNYTYKDFISRIDNDWSTKTGWAKDLMPEDEKEPNGLTETFHRTSISEECSVLDV